MGRTFKGIKGWYTCPSLSSFYKSMMVQSYFSLSLPFIHFLFFQETVCPIDAAPGWEVCGRLSKLALCYGANILFSSVSLSVAPLCSSKKLGYIFEQWEEIEYTFSLIDVRLYLELTSIGEKSSYMITGVRLSCKFPALFLFLCVYSSSKTYR